MRTLIASMVVAMLAGCGPQGKAPTVHMCKLWADEAACWDDERCEWHKGAFPNSGQCKAK